MADEHSKFKYDIIANRPVLGTANPGYVIWRKDKQSKIRVSDGIDEGLKRVSGKVKYPLVPNRHIRIGLEYLLRRVCDAERLRGGGNEYTRLHVVPP